MNLNEPVSDRSTEPPDEQSTEPTDKQVPDLTHDRKSGRTDGGASGTTVVCHVRAPLLFEPIDRQIETLQACESAGTIDSLLLRSWPKEVSLGRNGPHEEVIETVEQFDRWADQRGVTVRPPFRERTVSQLTGEPRTLLVTPILMIEVYVDDRLVGVFPHSDGEETYSAADAIATLRAGDVPKPLATAPEPNPAGATCPECEQPVVDGQGVYSCVDCSWVGALTAGGEYVPLEEVRTRRATGARVVRP